MGLGEEIRPRLVPSPGSMVQQSDIDYYEVVLSRYKSNHFLAQSASRNLTALRKSSQIHLDVSPNWGFGGGVRSPLGSLHLKADGVLAGNLGLDMMLQYFSDQGLCLTQRQRFYRVLIAGGMGLSLGALGMGISAFALAAGSTVGNAALFSLVTTTGIGMYNEFFVKPRIFKNLGLQQ